MAPFDGRKQCLLSPVLNRLVDSENYGLTRMRLNLITLKGAALGIGLQVQLAGFAANSVVIKLLDSAESHFISTDKAQHVRRQRVIRIKTLRLFARINTFKV